MAEVDRTTLDREGRRLEPSKSPLRGVTHRLWKDRWIYLFLLPTLILYAVYTIWPIAASWWYAFFDWDGFARRGTFIGLANFSEVTRDQRFWSAFRNTFLFVLIPMPIRIILALVLALILNNDKLPLSNFFRTALFLPVVTTAAIIGIVMNLVLSPAGGPVNLFLLNLGLIDRPINFLGTTDTALYSAMGVWVWKWLGITLIYWLAALQTIPKELYEAARVDGANTFQLLRSITLPLLTPFTIIIVLLTAVDATNVFDLLLTLTDGGPFFASEVIDIYIYKMAFSSTIPRLGYASAVAVFFGLIMLFLTAAQLLGVSYARRRVRALR